jgi:hypothetical protein
VKSSALLTAYLDKRISFYTERIPRQLQQINDDTALRVPARN